MFGFFGERRFEHGGCFEMDFAGCDVFAAGALKAELADSEGGAVGILVGSIHPQRRAEGTAGHGAGGVEVAESGGGIEGGAGFFVGEVFEVGGSVFVEDACARVAGETGSETSDGLMSAGSNGCGSWGIGGVEAEQAFMQTGRVQLRDRKDTDAALGASRSAFQPGAGAPGCVGYSGIDDLDELGVAVR